MLNTVDGEVSDYWNTNGIELTECAMLLGTPVARTAEQIQSLTIDIVNSPSSYFESINSSTMPYQDALTLLRLATASKLDYVSQLTAPSLSLPALELFDANVRHNALNKLQLSYTLRTGAPVTQRLFCFNYHYLCVAADLDCAVLSQRLPPLTSRHTYKLSLLMNHCVLISTLTYTTMLYQSLRLIFFQ